MNSFWKMATLMSIMFLISCKKYSDYSLAFKNDSNISVSGVLLTDYIDSIPANVDDLSNGIFHVPPHYWNVELFIARGSSLREAFKRGAPKDTISLILFNSDTLVKYGWENTRKNYRILKRYDLTYDSLRAINSQVYFE